MKIEIELEEVEYLRELNKNLESQLRDTQNAFTKYQESVNKKILHDKAIDFATQLTEKYIDVILRHIGVRNSKIENYRRNKSLHISPMVLNERWENGWHNNEDKIRVLVCADIINEFRDAYISIGLKPQTEVEKEDKYFEI